MTRVRVLIADPEERLLLGYRERIGGEFELFTARSARECIDRLPKLVPDVLVLEPQLPLGGGEAVLAMMHTVPALADVSVMILTACRDRVILESVAAYRISDYFVKPLAPAQLATRIRNVLDNRARRRATADDAEFEDHWDARRSESVIVGI